MKTLEIDTPFGTANAHLNSADEPQAALVLGHGAGGGVQLVGGRSSGARVACRTAETTGAVGVLCLAFPLQPPRRSGATPAQSRLPELDAVTVPMLVVQGTRDPFGMPPATERRTVVQVAGDHSLRTDLRAVGEAVRAWLLGVVLQSPTAQTS